ncbi:hypothetical protein EWM64_g8808 [Hericium alpestre]|uniref:Uncharacterized protein n=1 Tax=Hericium alpestre TaxID=135208 RepID=A0A4Y9ZK80_9AGAM|nr:hypothetical protein EWM64_g8808 [Hericium alpestre]
MFVATVPVHILKHMLDDRTQSHADEDRHPSHQIPPGLPRIPFHMPEPDIPSEKPCSKCSMAASSTPSKNEAAPVATSRSGPLAIMTIATGEEADEEQYRTHLKHEFHAGHMYRSLFCLSSTYCYLVNLPLWMPSPIVLGAVGYLSKPQGWFVTLFNAFEPLESSSGHASYIKSLSEYGSIKQGHNKQNRFTAVHHGLHHAQDHLALDWSLGYPEYGLLLSHVRNVSHPFSISSWHLDAFDVQANRETAHLYTEKANHKHIKNLEHPKLWLRNYVDDIVRIYGHEHGIKKADLIFVAGALDAREHMLFITWVLTIDVASGEDMPKTDTHDLEVALKLASLAHKVSTVKVHHEKWNMVLITPLHPEVETKEVSKT